MGKPLVPEDPVLFCHLGHPTLTPNTESSCGGPVGTPEFQIEDTAKIITQLKKSIIIIFIYFFLLQNARYQLPFCLGHTAVTLAKKLMPFFSHVEKF